MSGLPFDRYQFQLTLGLAIMDHKCQESTFTSLILDLRFPAYRGNNRHKWTSINVQLGRLRTLSGVWLGKGAGRGDHAQGDRRVARVRNNPHFCLSAVELRIFVIWPLPLGGKAKHPCYKWASELKTLAYQKLQYIMLNFMGQWRDCILTHD